MGPGPWIDCCGVATVETYHNPAGLLQARVHSAIPSAKQPLRHMSKFSLFILLALVALIGGGAFFVLTWDIPPPTSKVEKVIPDARFSR